MDALTLAASQFYKDNCRPDGRSFAQNAAVVVEHHKKPQFSSLSGLKASTTVRYGGTVVTCTAKARLVHLHPYASPNIDDYLRIVQSGLVESSGNNPSSPLAEKIHDIIEFSEAIDFKCLLSFTRPSGAVDVDMVESSESAICKWIWRLSVDFYIVRSDGCQLPASLLAVLAALSDLKIPTVKVSDDYICDHTGLLADELEFDLRLNKDSEAGFQLLSLDVNEARRVHVPVSSVTESSVGKLNLKTFPFAISFAFIADSDSDGDSDNSKYLLDPSAVEESLCCSTVTIVCTCDKVFSISTTGCGLSFSHNNKGQELVLHLVQLAQSRSEQLSQSCCCQK